MTKQWRQRGKKVGPTPEQLRQRAYIEVDAEDAGESYAMIEHHGALGDLLRAGEITERQYMAGRYAEPVIRAGMGSPSTRSCLDFSPVGHEPEDDTAEERLALAEYREFRSAYRNHPSLWTNLLHTVWQDQRPQFPFSLRSALDVAADFFKVGK